MRKKVIFGTVAALFLGAGIFTSVNLTQKPKMSNLTLANIEAITFETIDMHGQRDNPKGCTTTKAVNVEVVIGGEIKTVVQVQTVRGMENHCARAKSSSCTAFSCQ